MTRPCFIAEVSSNHNLSLNRCKKIIKEAKNSGFEAVKFQLFKIESLFHQSILKKSKLHRQRKKWELPLDFIPHLKKECIKNKIKFGCTPFYLNAVDQLNPYVDFFKISSYEILREDLLIKCAKTKKPIIISTGMANFKEVSKAIKILKLNGAKKIYLLHCVSEYPANYKNLNLNSINFLREKFKIPVGWSDHTRDELVIKEIIDFYKVNIIEFHIDLDTKGYEYKQGHCWLPNQIKRIINFYNNRKIIKGFKFKKPSEGELLERDWRADPSDGLRPLKKIRNNG